MFQELKNLVNHQNKHKIKVNQRYLNNDHSQHLSQDSSQISFDQQINDRLHAFHILTDQNIQNKANQQREYQRKQLKRYKNERDLLQEKIKIDKQMHEKQLEYLSERYQRQISTLKAQIEKYQFSSKRHLKQQGIILSLKKDSRHIFQLHQEDQKIIEKLSQELLTLKRQNTQLKMIIRKKEQAETELKANKYIESQNEIKLKNQIAILEQQKADDKERKKYLQTSIKKLKAEKDDLERLVDKNKHEFDSYILQLKQKCKNEVHRLEDDNKQLKKRNQLIEDSFIDHLTQTSLNLQQNIKTIPERTMKNNSSLYLQQSPIRTRSKDRERSNTLIEDDPQKRNNQSCKCGSKINKLRSKLQQANYKIVQLLKQKCSIKTRTNIK